MQVERVLKLYLRLAAKVWLRVFGVKNLCNTDGTIDNMASTESFVGSVNKGSRDSAESKFHINFTTQNYEYLYVNTYEN